MTRPRPCLPLLALVTALAAGVCGSCAQPSRASARGPTLRVATWNVHDLFDEHDRREPPGQDDEVPTAAEVARKLERVAAVLRELDADVVVLQEVENLALLERLASGPARGLGYRAFLVEGLDPRGIDVALLSRAPVERYASHVADLDARGVPLWSRDLVEVHLRAPGGRRVVVFGTHLVSQRRPSKDGRRERQAARIRALADGAAARWPDALVLVAGDLNDEPTDPPLAPLLADGTWLDLGARLPRDRGWTWGGRSRLDYLLVHRRDGARVLAVTVWPGKSVAQASDHRPVVADLAP
jgi:endonuclease/exonuclease/phosphatase family metal-dependent hydrolase